MRCCRFSLKTILVTTFVIAAFFAGYRWGYESGFSEANNWDEVGGSGSISAFPLVIQCFTKSDDQSDHLSDHAEADHPTGDTVEDPFGDPFSQVEGDQELNIVNREESR